MSFVNELVPENEKERLRAEFPSLQRNVDGTNPTLSRWTVDRENGATFITLEKRSGAYGGTSDAYRFALILGSCVFQIDASPQLIKRDQGPNTLAWDVSRLLAPAGCEGDVALAKQSICSALTARGFNYADNIKIHVEVKFGDRCVVAGLAI